MHTYDKIKILFYVLDSCLTSAVCSFVELNFYDIWRINVTLSGMLFFILLKSQPQNGKNAKLELK